MLADTSGYADLMVGNQTAAMHGQTMVTMMIEAMLKQVEIPLRLQEMEGDADFSAFSLCIWDLRSETGSLKTASTVIQSADAETSRPHSGTA